MEMEIGVPEEDGEDGDSPECKPLHPKNGSISNGASNVIYKPHSESLSNGRLYPSSKV